MKFRFLFVLFLGTVHLLLAQTPSAYQSFTTVKDTLIVQTSSYKILFQPYAPKTIRVTYLPNGQYTLNHSEVLVGKPMPIRTAIADKQAYIQFATDSLLVRIDKQSLHIQFIDPKKGTPIGTNQSYLASADKGGNLKFALDDQEALYGAGSRAIPQNRRGYLLENYHQPHYGYGYGEQNLNVSIPLIVSSKGYAIYFENPSSGTFDLGKTQKDQLVYTAENGQLSYFFIQGTNDQILNAYTKLTGKQPLPPRWAMGFIQSRFGYKSAEETLETVKKTKAAGYPIDATVLDLFWYGEIKTIGNHDWRRDSFPEPEKMIRELKQLGVKTIPITQTFVTKLSDNFDKVTQAGLFTKNADGKDYIIEDFWAGPAGLLDIFKPQTQHYLWNFYRKRIDDGVAGWWCDLGEPEKHPDGMIHTKGMARDVHSIYPLTWSKTIYEGYRKDFPTQRVFNLARSGGAGMQRYATFPWSGDVLRSWNGFKAQIPVMLGMSMSGIGYMHSDAGGFGQGEKDAELYIRWMQFAAFTPIYRAHADPAVAAPEPVFWDKSTQDLVKPFVKLRYRFLPYNYSLAYQNAKTGRPLALPLNYFDAANPKLISVDDAYLWGSDLLVAPILEKGKTDRKVLFPKGKWIGWWDGKTYSDSALIKADLSSLPLFARSGSIIPLTTDLENTEKYTGDTLIVRYFPDVKKQASFTLYEDDGNDPDAISKENYQQLELSGTPAKQGQLLEISSSKPGKAREVYFEVSQAKPARKVLESGKMLIAANSAEQMAKQAGSYWYDSERKILHIHYRFAGNQAKLTVY
jgi:alpha-glucosidase (family GH31 glycosyl hydrolase)